MSALEVGQEFPSLADFKKALRYWAIKSNFTPAILDSDSRRVRAGCRIRCNFNNRHNIAIVTTLEDTHTCSSAVEHGSQGIKRAEACKLKFLLEAVPHLMTVDHSTSTKSIINAVKAKYGQEIAMRQAQKVKAILAPKSASICNICGAQDHDKEQCPNDPRTSLNQQEDQDHTMTDTQSSIRGEQDDLMDAHQTQQRQSHLQLPPQTQPQTQPQAQPPPPPPPPLQLPAQSQTQPSMRQISNHTENGRIATRPSSVHGFQPPSSQMVQNMQRENSRPPIDPSLVNGQNNIYRVPQQQPSPPSQSTTQTQPSTQTSFSSNREQSSQSAAEVRMEAAKLMHRAAQLMQEASRLNMEAAKMNASVANA